MEPYSIRPATEADISFLADVVVNAEKSGTDRCGLATVFGLTEDEVHTLVEQMLGEEEDGCEFSVSSYLVAADAADRPVAAFGGWIEDGENPSALLKSNLLAFTFGGDRLKTLKENADVVSGILVSRTPGTLQLEYLYVAPEARGHRLGDRLIDAHIQQALDAQPGLQEVEVQLFGNNAAARHLYERAGFREKARFTSSHPATGQFLPDAVKVLMSKSLPH